MAEGSKKAGAARRVVWGRRFLAATVVVPPSMADHLNMDAMAVLAVIRNEAAATGRCTLPVARIAERANIGRAKARAAIRLAESLGAIAIEAAPDRRRVEMLFAHLKRILRIGRLRLRGPRGAQFEFTLAAIAQNLRRLAKLVARPPPLATSCLL